MVRQAFLVRNGLGASALLEIGVADAGVVHRFELFHEGGLDLVDVAEGQRGVAHESVGYLPVDDLIDQCADCLLYTSPSPRDTERSRMPSSA